LTRLGIDDPDVIACLNAIANDLGVVLPWNLVASFSPWGTFSFWAIL